MSTLALGDPLPDLAVAADGGRTLRLREYLGKNLILYFYPKDDTPGCTQESQDFRDHHGEFEALDTVVVGISRDNVRSHDRFKAKHCFPFDLVSDEDETLCRTFDVIKMKNMYGKQVRGIQRSTFLFDRSGVLVHEWRGVKVPGHVDAVLEKVRELG